MTEASQSQSTIQLDPTNPLPRHIAIIMDGNGRWAKERGLPRIEGHRQGSNALESTIEWAANMGIEYLTVYAFSSENWRRPADEVDGLVDLMRLYLQTKVVKFHENGIRLKILGDYKAFPADVVGMMQEAMDLTKNNTRLTLNVALNYGGRAEILQATQQLAQQVASGQRAVEDITEAAFSDCLWTSGTPDPEIFIRTSGEHRISNYLLWQLSYTELIFMDKYWPDFEEEDLLNAVTEYQGRHRRFGAL